MKITRTNEQYASIINYYKDSKAKALEGCDVCPCCGGLVIRQTKKNYTSRDKTERCKHFYECSKCGAAWESDFYETYNPKIGKNLHKPELNTCPFCHGALDDRLLSTLHLSSGRARTLFALLHSTNLANYLSKLDDSVDTGNAVEVKLHYL